MARLIPFLLPGLAVFILASTGKSDDLIVSQIRSHHKGIAVWWTGNDGWLIKSGDILIATDLTLDNDEKVHPPPVTASEIAPDVDVLFGSRRTFFLSTSEPIRKLRTNYFGGEAIPTSSNVS